MMQKILLVLLLISLSACKQKLDEVSIRSLSGKSSSSSLGISSPLRLVKDFNPNMLAMIDEKIVVADGFFFTLNNCNFIVAYIQVFRLITIFYAIHNKHK